MFRYTDITTVITAYVHYYSTYSTVYSTLLYTIGLLPRCVVAFATYVSTSTIWFTAQQNRLTAPFSDHIPIVKGHDCTCNFEYS